MKRKWSEEAILRNRRKRMARRLFKKEPLFAVNKIKNRFSIDYDETALFKDIPLKGGKAPKKRRGRRKINGKKDYLNTLKTKIQFALSQNDQEQIQKIISRYYQIQDHVTKPWKVQVNIPSEDKLLYYLFPTRLTKSDVQDFMNEVNKAIAKGASKEDVDLIHDKHFDRYAYGG